MDEPQEVSEPEYIVVFGSYDPELHPRVEVIYEGLVARGIRTKRLNVPLGLSSASRAALLKKPHKAFGFFLKILLSWRRLTTQALRLRKTPIRAVIVGYMGHFDILLAKLLFPKATMVLDYLVSFRHAAQDRSIATKGVATLFKAIDFIATTVADIVLVDTVENIATVPLRNRLKSKVVSVGANGLWFRSEYEPKITVSNPGPLRLIFFGTYSPLQGANVISDAMVELWKNEVDFRLTLVGQGPDRVGVQKSLAFAGQKVKFVDWLPVFELLEQVQGSDVCFGIFGTSPKGSSVVPNKVFQGLAAGCVVITSDTPPQRRLMADAALYVPAGDSGTLASLLMDLSADRSRVMQMKSLSKDYALRHFRPEQIVVPLIGAL